MTVSPPDGNEKPQKHYGGPYLNEVQDFQQEVTRAAAEGREVNTENFDNVTVGAVAPHLIDPDAEVNKHDPGLISDDIRVIQEGNAQNALTNDNQLFDQEPVKIEGIETQDTVTTSENTDSGYDDEKYDTAAKEGLDTEKQNVTDEDKPEAKPFVISGSRPVETNNNIPNDTTPEKNEPAHDLDASDNVELTDAEKRILNKNDDKD